MAPEVVAPQPANPTAPSTSSDTREARLKVYDRVLATVSAIGLIAGGVWGMYTYSEAKRKETEQKTAEAQKNAELRESEARQQAAQAHREAAQRDKELQLRKHELDLLIFKERKEAYYALCDAACEIAACRDRKEVVERSHGFLKLYNGRAHIIAEADEEVSAKKIAFKRKLMKYLDGEDKDSTVSPFAYFESEAFQLTQACRKHVDPRSLATSTP